MLFTYFQYSFEFPIFEFVVCNHFTNKTIQSLSSLEKDFRFPLVLSVGEDVNYSQNSNNMSESPQTLMKACINFSRLRGFGSIRSPTVKQFAFEFEKHLQQRYITG